MTMDEPHKKYFGAAADIRVREIKFQETQKKLDAEWNRAIDAAAELAGILAPFKGISHAIRKLKRGREEEMRSLGM